MKRLIALLLPVAAFAAAPVPDWSPNATWTAAWNNNASNGEATWDRVGALQLGADVLASSQFNFGAGDAAHATLHLAGDWYPRFSKLDRGAVGGRLDWQHTFGVGPSAPVFTAEIGGDAVATVESARRGMGGFADLHLTKRFGTVWLATVRQRFETYAAKGSVFDASGRVTSLELSRDFSGATRFTLSGSWRQGDVVTYAQYDRPDLMAIAHDWAALNTFKRRMTAYATDARTIGGRAALVHATAEDTAIVLAYDYANTSRTGLRYVNRTLSLSLVRQY